MQWLSVIHLVGHGHMKYPSFLISSALGLCLSGVTGVQAQTDTTRKPTPTSKAAAASAGKGALRIICEGDNAGAEISINGAAKGRCPFDMEVPAGKVLLRAVKPINAEWERSHEEELTLGSGVVRKVDVNVGYRRPTAETVRRWEAAASAGDAEAMYQLGWVYKWGTTRTIDFVKAASYFRRAAAAGHPAGTNEYSEALWRGRGVAVNVAEAKQLQSKAAELGDGDALAEIGANLYFGSEGFPKDERKALEYFKKSLAAGSTYAVGYLDDVEPDQNNKDALDRKKFEIDTRLADAGNMRSLFNLAIQFWFGNKGMKIKHGNFERHGELSAQVFAYTLKAAATGDPSSLVELGESYRVGKIRGAPKDKFLSEQAYRAAIAKGSVEAKEKLAKLLAE